VSRLGGDFSDFYQAKQSYAITTGVSRNYISHPRVLHDDIAEFSEMEQMMMIDTLTYLTDDILVKVDRAAMNNSLETRIPLLDHTVFEAAWRMQHNRQLESERPKQVLQNVIDTLVPRSLSDRPKRGFNLPISEWMNHGLRDWTEAQLAHPLISGGDYVSPPRIQKLWQAHQSGDFRGATVLWPILMLASWHDSFFSS